MSGIGNLLLLISLNFYASPRYTTGVVNEPFSIDVTVESEHMKDIPEPVQPSIPNFSFVGKSVSTSTSISIINGKMKSTYTRTYTYTYIPQKKGTFTIPPFKLSYKGKIYKTEPFTVHIGEGKSEREPAQTLSPIFIRTIVSRKKVYRGEGILVEYKLYSRKPITGISPSNSPEYDKFWKEDVYTPKTLSTDIEVYRGIRFYTITLKKLLLYPLETGSIKIPAPGYNVQVESGDFFDFFGKTYSVKAESPVINVMPLPEPVPDDFTGGVGEFTARAYFEKDTVMTGEGANLVLEMKGKGNIRFITAPEIRSTTGIHIYSPEEEVKAKPTETGDQGRKLFKYLMVCTSPGIKTLKPISISYFSPSKRTYVKLKLNIPPLVVYGGTRQEKKGEKIKGTDIAYIKTGVNMEKNFRLIPVWVPVLLIFFTILPLGMVLYDIERRKSERDIGYARLKKLPGITKKAFRELKNAMLKKDEEEFLKVLYKLLLDFIKYRFNVEAYGMTVEEIQSTLRAKGFEEALIERFINLIRVCEERRFTPVKEGIDMDWLYRETREVINGIA